MIELKPCPFCGYEAEVERMGTNKVSMIITCSFCGCSLETGETYLYERMSWNRRDNDTKTVNSPFEMMADDPVHLEIMNATAEFAIKIRDLSEKSGWSKEVCCSRLRGAKSLLDDLLDGQFNP